MWGRQWGFVRCSENSAGGNDLSWDKGSWKRKARAWLWGLDCNYFVRYCLLDNWSTMPSVSFHFTKHWNSGTQIRWSQLNSFWYVHMLVFSILNLRVWHYDLLIWDESTLKRIQKSFTDRQLKNEPCPCPHL